MDNFLVDNDSHALFDVPHSLYKPNQQKLLSTRNEAFLDDYESFEYTLNEYGFRYKTPAKDNVLLAVGCSMTFGQGVPVEKTYPYIVSKSLDYDCVNVALPGTGPDIQILNATWALLKYKPKVILFYMSTPNRRFLASKNGFMNYVPQYDHVNLEKIEQKTILSLDEKYDYTRTLQTVWQLYPFIELCKLLNTQVYFTCWDKEVNDDILSYNFMSYTKPLGNINGKIDKARDSQHPGILSHKDFSERILDAIRVYNN